MGILAASADERVRDVRFDDATLSVELMDGRTITVPLALDRAAIKPRSSTPPRPSAPTGRSRVAATVSTGPTSTRT